MTFCAMDNNFARMLRTLNVVNSRREVTASSDTSASTVVPLRRLPCPAPSGSRSYSHSRAAYAFSRSRRNRSVRAARNSA